MPPADDPYRALGVARGATAADIKKAHRRLAKRYHPGASEGDARRFLVVQEAYRVLSDPLLRRDWDARHAPGPMRATDTPKKKAPTARPQPKQTRQPRQPRAGERPAEPAQEAPAPGARPRSARSYTWSASEVPWWGGARPFSRGGGGPLPPRGVSRPGGGHPRPPGRARAAAEADARRKPAAD